MLNRSVDMKKQLLLIALAIHSLSAGAYTYFDDKPFEQAKQMADAWVKSQRLLGPALYRSRHAIDEACDKQWQIPLRTGTSRKEYPAEFFGYLKSEYGFEDRGTTVIYADEQTGLKPLDILVPSSDDPTSEKNIKELSMRENRLLGWNYWNDDERAPFKVKVGNRDTEVTVTPFKTCKGRVNTWFYPIPAVAILRTFITVPLMIFDQDITPDEALWMTLWVQGFEFEGQGTLNMLTLTRTFLGAVQGYMVGSATNSVIQAGTNGVQAMAKETAQQVAHSTATHAAKQAMIEAAKKQAEQMIQDTTLRAAATNMATRFGTNVVGQKTLSLEMIFAGTVFGKTDVWTFSKMIQLGADPTAAISLHRKLVAAGIQADFFIMDEERQKQFDAMLDRLDATRNGQENPKPDDLTQK